MTKEKNLVRMLGVLPSQGADPIPVGKIPDGGTQVAKYALSNGAETLIHTVTDGKTLYLSALAFSIRNVSGSDAQGHMWVTDADDGTQYYFFNIQALDNTGPLGSISFPTPLEIPAGYKIKVKSSQVDAKATGFIHGYEA